MREVEESDNDRTYKKMISIPWNIGKRWIRKFWYLRFLDCSNFFKNIINLL